MDASFEQPAPRTSEVFLTLKTVGEEDRISLGQLTGLLGDRAFGLLVLIFALPNIIPMIPGVSTVSGVVIAIVGLQMLIAGTSPCSPPSSPTGRCRASKSPAWWTGPSAG